MLTNYIKIAWKVLLRHPFYTFITLFGISLTLTVLMVLTSFLDHLVGTHYPEMKRDRSLYLMLMVQRDSAHTGRSSGPMSFKFLTNYAKTLKTPERVTIFSAFNSSNAYVGSQKIKLKTKFTDADFWQVMDFKFLEGKPYNEQNIANGDYVVVITDDFRKQYFSDATESVIGKDVDIENIHYKVIGVVKGSPVTRPVTCADVYFPYTAPKSNYQRDGMRGGFMSILLARDKSDLPAINEEFQSRISQIPLPGVENGYKYTTLEVKSEPYAENFIGQIIDGGPGLKAILFGVIGFILFMLLGLPAINLVNVNVSRIMERGSEIGVRKAFGAPVRTLVWQFIIENIFITFIGGAIALLLTSIVIYFINSSGWIAYADLTINLSVFLISILVCLIFGFLSGVLPALRMSKLTIAEALKS
ncbi:MULTISPECIES: ABC transporter permease [unclassified Spirosoma]|uniref:ABC transporter permease n=1 Tax=unclassified Spirosoma TaxID=2621999 RepID=UPI0009698191|nr:MULTISPECIES: ABC transporter permease [unclassified Spirosoma]MBN8826087.1 ABC transporter permease [Spirosoma sp.]OJW74576.1 MAG: ABC transporter permease [Spirosoma sp. 48-14]